MASQYSWPEEPFRLIATTFYQTQAPSLAGSHAAVRTAQLMALTHNTIFRALNAIYLQSSHVRPENVQDVADLATFATFALDFLDNHHKVEELVFFPMLEAQTGNPGLMDDNVRQHREFDEPLQSLRQYLDEMKAGPGRFNAEELRRRIGALANPLQRHLRDEIPTLLDIGKILDGDMIYTCYKAMHDEAEGTTDPFKIGPLVLGCQDRSFLLDDSSIQFPVLPFALVPYIVEWFVQRRFSGAWRFCPSTFHGEPRDTEFFQRPRNGSMEGKRAAKSSSDFVKPRKSSKAVVIFLVLALVMCAALGRQMLRQPLM